MNQPPVTFTIDGIEFTSDDRRQTASQLLSLAGVDPVDHDLALVLGHGETKRFADDDEIQITPGARYLSIFNGPTPVV